MGRMDIGGGATSRRSDAGRGGVGATLVIPVIGHFLEFADAVVSLQIGRAHEPGTAPCTDEGLLSCVLQHVLL